MFAHSYSDFPVFGQGLGQGSIAKIATVREDRIHRAGTIGQASAVRRWRALEETKVFDEAGEVEPRRGAQSFSRLREVVLDGPQLKVEALRDFSIL